MSSPQQYADRSDYPETQPLYPLNAVEAGVTNYPSSTAPPDSPPAATPTAMPGSQLPITTQPMGGMNSPQGTGGQMPSMRPVHSNHPQGLDYLSTVDFLLVKQKVERLEVFSGFETTNKYTIRNNQGQTIYYAFEESDNCARCCFGSLRGFDIKVIDSQRNQILHFQRENACSELCPEYMRVYAGANEYLGSVEPVSLTLTPEFDIKDATGRSVLKLEGPLIRIGNSDFKIYSADKSTLVGKISKSWGGFARELFTDADNFGVSFPMDLGVRTKAVILGATFLVDFMYYESH